MRNKTISKILIAAGIFAVAGAGFYGTSQNTNYNVAANRTIAQGRNAFEGLKLSYNKAVNNKKASNAVASNNNASNTQYAVTGNGIYSGQVASANGATSCNDALAQSVFNCNNNGVTTDTNAVNNLAKDDNTSLADKLYLTSTVKSPATFRWVSCIKNSVLNNSFTRNNSTSVANNNAANTEKASQDTVDKNVNNTTEAKNDNTSNTKNETNDTNNVATITNNNSNTTKTTATKNTSVAENTTAANEDSYIAEIEQLIFNKVNAERSAAGLSPLTYNNTMQKYARMKSKDMGDRGYFDHKNPEGQLITVQMQKDGVSYNSWGENIAYIGGMSGNSALADKFMTNWMNSSGHRANILSTNYSSIGVGVYKIGNKYYATQEFYR